MKKTELQDYKEIIDNSLKQLQKLHNKTVFITGATGFIGSSFVKTILYYNNSSEANITIVALVRDINKAETLFSCLSSKNLYLIKGSVETLPQINYHIDYIIHGASITSSADFVSKAVDTILTNVTGTENILNLAKEKNVKSVLYLSTMEVYGAINSNNKKIAENDYGYIDVVNVRNSYPLSKQMTENLCVAYAEQYNVNVKIARLTQTIGPNIDYNDSRIAAMFARSVIEGKDIVLNTKAATTRNIVYINDAISAMLFLLVKGESGQTYNVAQSKEVLSIAETAKMIASKIAKNKIEVVFDIKEMKEYAINKELYLHLDTTALEKLGWQAKIDTEEAYRRMIKGMME